MSSAERDLLAQYVRDQDAEAFSTLFERHQHMVFAVCRRILGNAADAEDAAQTCFLQLARRAGDLRGSVAGWLHRVAVGVCVDMVRRDQARRRREAGALPTQPEEPSWQQIREAVDEAIADLPEALRAPVVLYYLERRKQEEIAADLSVTQSAVSQRLAKGVAALRRRLRRAGWLGPAALLASLLATQTAEAAPATLTVALGKMAVAGMGSGSKAAAAEAAKLGGMQMLKLSAVTAVIAGGIIAGVLAGSPRGAPTQPPARPAAQPDPEAQAPAPQTQPALPLPQPAARTIKGKALLPDGLPAAGATVKLFYCHDLSGYGSRWLSEAKCDAEGRFALDWPEFKPPAKNVHFGPRRLYVMALVPGYAAGISEATSDPEEECDVRVNRSRELKVRVVRPDGSPVAGARVATAFYGVLSSSYRRFPQYGLYGVDAVVAILAVAMEGGGETAADGTVTIRDCTEGPCMVIAQHEAWGINLTGAIGDKELKVVMAGGTMKIAGRITYSDTGKPVSGAIVRAKYDHVGFVWWRECDAGGRYELTAPVPPLGNGVTDTQINVLAFDPSADSPYAPSWTMLPAAKDRPTRPVDLQLERGILLGGRVIRKDTGVPLPGSMVLASVTGEGDDVLFLAQTDAKGAYGIVLRGTRANLVALPPAGLVRPDRPLEGPEDVAVGLTEPLKNADIPVIVAPEMKLAVRVRNVDGGPAADAPVVAGCGHVTILPAVTDAQGHATLRGAPAGSQVTLYATDGSPRRAAFAAIEAAAKPDPVTLTLQPTVSGDIVLEDEAGAPLRDIGSVSVHFCATDAWPEYNFTGWSVFPDKEKQAFVVSGLLPEVDYVVQVKWGDKILRRQWRIPADARAPKVTFRFGPSGASETTEEDFAKELAALQGFTSKQADPVNGDVTWYVLPHGLAVADAKRRTVDRYPSLLGLAEFTVTAIAFGQDKVWIGTDKGLMAWDRKGQFWARVAVGGRMIEADVKGVSITDDGKLRVTVDEKGKERRFEYDPSAKKWSAD